MLLFLRSDALKVTSSGHSSGDEIETTTSSDIEVISRLVFICSYLLIFLRNFYLYY